jgi:hypothetical protein
MKKSAKMPSPPPSPQWGEGGGEGKFQIFLDRILQHDGYGGKGLLIRRDCDEAEG